MPSRGLTRFLAALSRRPSPVLMDIGPVVGANVTLFGERLGCKLLIEDVFASIDRHARAGTMNLLAAALETRFPRPDGAVDGVLCWDCFDFLDPSSARTLARQIVRLVKPGGVVMGIFCTSTVAGAGYVKYEVNEEMTLTPRLHPGGGGTRHALLTGEISRLFDGLSLSDSFLLKNNAREILFRRP